MDETPAHTASTEVPAHKEGAAFPPFDTTTDARREFRKRHAADDQLTILDLKRSAHGAGDSRCAASHCSSIVKMNTSSP